MTLTEIITFYEVKHNINIELHSKVTDVIFGLFYSTSYTLDLEDSCAIHFVASKLAQELIEIYLV